MRSFQACGEATGRESGRRHPEGGRWQKLLLPPVDSQLMERAGPGEAVLGSGLMESPPPARDGNGDSGEDRGKGRDTEPRWISCL